MAVCATVILNSWQRTSLRTLWHGRFMGCVITLLMVFQDVVVEVKCFPQNSGCMSYSKFTTLKGKGKCMV